MPFDLVVRNAAARYRTVSVSSCRCEGTRAAGRGASCQQEIASDGAFALGMLADFGEPIRQPGAGFYERLHWEAGRLGRGLYLEAEAAEIRSAGIACFFDDVIHEVLGLRGGSFRTIRHFTVGRAVDDPRLRTAAAQEPRERTG